MSISVWQSIKKKLRVRVNPILIKVWIDPLEATYDNGVVRLVAPNEFVESWVRDNLMGRIREAVGEVLDENVGVVLSRAASAGNVSNHFETQDAFLLNDSERILCSINRLHKRFKFCIGLEEGETDSDDNPDSWDLEGSEDSDSSILQDEIDAFGQPDFDEVLDAVLEAFGISFREIMSGDSDDVVLAKRALFYLCARYDVPPDEVAMNMDCTVSEVKNGAREMDQEIAAAIDSGTDLDQLLVRLFNKA